jgi:DUF2075 family protein
LTPRNGKAGSAVLLEVDQFCDRVRRNMPLLVEQLQEETGRYTPAEKRAWEHSLPRLADVLSHPDLGNFHLHLSERGALDLEYRLPASASWCDVVLLGRGDVRPVAVIVELKDWDVRGDRPGPRSGLVTHRGELVLHPSEQVRGYVDYCRGFHSAVVGSLASVEGCVLFTGEGDLTPYSEAPHAALVRQFPLFSSDEPEQPAQFLRHHLRRPDPAFAEAFGAGRYQQDRNFVSQVADVIRDPAHSPFVLLDEQRQGFEFCLQQVEDVLRRTDGKAVIIVEGPPGSGKSVLAAHVWASLVKNPAVRGSVVFTTTSDCQKSNWRSLYERTRSGSKAVVVGANRYNPGLTSNKLKAGMNTVDWRKHIQPYLTPEKNQSPNDAYDVSVVDEAHALIDPTVSGVKKGLVSGWVTAAGPQAWHIIRSSRVSVFLMDPAQSFRENETTTADSIRRWAAEFGVPDVRLISLAGHQFRCGGSVEYVRWVESLLELPSTAGPTDGWQRSVGGNFHVETAASPIDLESYLRARIAEGGKSRLMASYAREWRTREAARPHTLPDDRKDFYLPYDGLEGRAYWARTWNHAPGGDYTRFIQAPIESPMHTDPLCEVGCPYVLRGFDFDHLGLLWLSDLVWRKDRWVANLDHVKETAFKRTLAAAKKGTGKNDPNLLRRLKQSYRILLTRAIKSLCIWFEDPETKEHVTKCLPK